MTSVEFDPGPEMIYEEKFKNYVNSFQVFKPDGKAGKKEYFSGIIKSIHIFSSNVDTQM